MEPAGTSEHWFASFWFDVIPFEFISIHVKFVLANPVVLSDQSQGWPDEKLRRVKVQVDDKWKRCLQTKCVAFVVLLLMQSDNYIANR